MSALDKAVAELDAKRSKDDAERRARQQAAGAFLKEFFDADLAPSQKLKHRGVQAAFDGKRILLLQATGPPPTVELVQHWTAALNK